MAKNELLSGLASFGEGFIKTLQAERERKRQEEEFNRKMAFETRQMNLLNLYRQKQLEIEGNKPFETKTGEVYPSTNGIPNFEKPLWTPPEAPPKPQTFDIEGSYKNPKTGTYWTFDKNVGKPIDLGIPYDKNKGKTTVNITTPQAPYIPTKDLEQDWSVYLELDKLDKNWKNTPQEERKIINNKGEIIAYNSYEDLKKAKERLYNNIKIESDDRAKKLNEEYLGFSSIYRDLMRDSAFRKAVKEGRGDAELFRVMQGFPEEAINEMKNLIYKRIF